MSVDTLVQVLGFIVTILVLAMTGVWQLGQMQAKIIGEIQKHRRELDEEIAKLRAEFAEQKLYSERTYLSKASFHTVMDRLATDLRNGLQRLSGELQGAFEKLEARLIRLEDRAAGVLSRHSAPGRDGR